MNGLSALRKSNDGTLNMTAPPVPTNAAPGSVVPVKLRFTWSVVMVWLVKSGSEWQVKHVPFPKKTVFPTAISCNVWALGAGGGVLGPGGASDAGRARMNAARASS